VNPDLDAIGKEFPVLNADAGEKMKAAIAAAKADGDSVGGLIECVITGVPAGLGDPMFDGMENRISSIAFGIPGVKGIEFGNGFACAELFGSENNDSFITDGEKITTKTNNHGGILGGITSGMPLIFRVALKPTPSIFKTQNTISLGEMSNTELTIKGRHDPCIAVRALACVEAVAAIAVYDALLEYKAR
jgi:chorismate synthase